MADQTNQHPDTELPDTPAVPPERPWAPLEETNPDHVVETFPSTKPTDAWNADDITLPIPPATRDVAKNQFSSMPNVRLLDNDPKAEEFRENMQMSSRLIVGNRALDDIDQRDNSNWQQTVQSEAGPLAASRPRIADVPGTTLTGDSAIHHVRSVLGMGGYINIPLWHSGFWITLRNPGDAALLELDRRLAQEKIDLGRLTYGAVYSNERVFYDNIIFKFAMDNLYETSLINKEDLSKKIKIHDLDTIAWGLACVIYPQGFQYARPVFNPTNGQYDNIKALLNVSKLQRTDWSVLTPAQIKHMSKRSPSTMSDESVQRYLDDFIHTQSSRYKLTDAGLSMELSVPSVEDYFETGMQWINNIVITADKVFGIDQDEKERDTYLQAQSNATNMRLYGHWVSKIITGGDIDGGAIDEKLIEDRNTIDELLAELSSVDDLRKTYFDAIRDYIKKTTTSIIAVPTLTAEDEAGAHPRFPRLIPINAMEAFFILLVQRARRIATR